MTTNPTPPAPPSPEAAPPPAPAAYRPSADVPRPPLRIALIILELAALGAVGSAALAPLGVGLVLLFVFGIGLLFLVVNAGSLAQAGDARALDIELNAGRADVELRGVEQAQYSTRAATAGIGSRGMSPPDPPLCARAAAGSESETPGPREGWTRFAFPQDYPVKSWRLTGL